MDRKNSKLPCCHFVHYFVKAEKPYSIRESFCFCSYSTIKRSKYINITKYLYLLPKRINQLVMRAPEAQRQFIDFVRTNECM